MAEPLLTLAQVSKYYTGNQAVTVGLNAVSLSFSRGEFVAVTGESGSGKSTLAHVIGGILPYESGELYFKGKETSHYDSLDWERYRRDNISFISQSYGILPGASVMKNVMSALILTGMDKSEAKTAAESILRQVELWELRRRRAGKLSSGQKQRLSIARALAKPAPILIADEPTGNLDPENSAKVISLLAEAARDRLVILVTHEFDEAKDMATRHIVLRDGRIESDTELRPANKPTESSAEKSPSKRKKRPLSPYVARLQCSGRPVWTTIMIGFFAITAFAVFAFLGVFIISLDDTSTRIYDNAAFMNGSVDRLVVMRGDGDAFTDEDYQRVLSASHVVSLEPNGYVADCMYGYRDGVDFITNYTELDFVRNVEDEYGMITEERIPYIQVSYQITVIAPFMQTVPVVRNGEKFLTGGRLPENFYEIVSADPDYGVGDTVTVLMTDPKNWNPGSKIRVEMTVVGVTDRGEGLYFHEDVAFLVRKALTMLDPETDGHGRYIYMPVYDLDDGTFRGNASVFPPEKAINYDHYVPSNNVGKKFQWLFTTLESVENSYRINADEFGVRETEPAKRMTFMILEMSDEPVPVPSAGEKRVRSDNPIRLVELSYNNFFKTTDSSPSDQISVLIEGYAYTDRVIAELRELGYTAVSPYKLGSTEQVPELVEERAQTLRVCLLALLAVITLQTVLLKALFGMQTESYRLLSNIGLVGAVAVRSVWWQILVFTAAGQILGALGIWICAGVGVERIAEMLTYLPPKYMLTLSVVHTAASLISAIWIVSALGRQVYPLEGKEEDIALYDGQEGE